MTQIKDSQLFGDICEYEDRIIGEILQARSYSMGRLCGPGPPDLCHTTKSCNRGKSADNFGTYHFVYGVDTSSSASIAAYVKSLVYSLDKRNKKESTKWSISSCTYCCYNAFSKIDVRVRICFPGGVKAYYIDMNGTSHTNISQKIWDEIYVSSVVRAIISSYEDFDKVETSPEYEVRKLDPIPTPGAENDFLQCVNKVFLDGPRLGAETHIFSPSIEINHLVTAIKNYFFNAGRAHKALELFKTLESKHNIDLSYSCAECYFNMDEEILAVECIYNALKDGPKSLGCMLLQIDYLIRKKEYRLAAEVANYAVIYYSSEFLCWEKLVEVYMAMGDYASALITLNSYPFNLWTTPNFLIKSKTIKEYPVSVSYPKGYTPSKFALQAPKSSESIYSTSNIIRNSFPGDLRQFYCFSQKVVIRRAYDLLTRMSSRLGWVKLLDYRAYVFVMENEYAAYKESMGFFNKQSIKPKNITDEPEAQRVDEDNKDRTSPSPSNDAPEQPEKYQDPDVCKEEGVSEKELSHSDSEALCTAQGSNDIQLKSHDGVPHADISHKLEDTDNVSMHSTRSDNHQLSTSSAVSEDVGIVSGKNISGVEDNVGHEIDKSENVSLSTYDSDSEKIPARNNIDDRGEKVLADTPPMKKCDIKVNSPFGVVFLENKQLCGKTLDTTFMSMYSEIKFYVWFKEDVNDEDASRDTKSPIIGQKTPVDWEIFGDLAYRYGDIENAVEAYKHCLEISTTLSSHLKLLKILALRKDIPGCLGLIVGIEIFYWTKNIQKTYPGFVANCLYMLIKEHGMSKVHNYLVSMNLPTFEYDLVDRYFKHAALFNIAGADS